MIKVATLKFTTAGMASFAHSANYVTTLTKDPIAQGQPESDLTMNVLHTLEGGIVPLNSLDQLLHIKEGDPFEIDEKSNIVRVDPSDTRYQQWIRLQPGQRWHKKMETAN